MTKLKQVNIDSNVFELILNHSLLNENEESMGLLIGNVKTK